MRMDEYAAHRKFMKSGICDIDIIATADIAKGVPQPPVEKPHPKGAKKIALPTIDRNSAPKADFFTCTLNRCSRRQYTQEPLSLFELAFLLWCTQGVKKVIGGYRKYIKDGSGRYYAILAHYRKSPPHSQGGTYFRNCVLVV